jgi:hypothetical protein
VRCCGRSSEAHAASKTKNFNENAKNAATSAQLVESGDDDLALRHSVNSLALRQLKI